MRSIRARNGGRIGRAPIILIASTPPSRLRWLARGLAAVLATGLLSGLLAGGDPNRSFAAPAEKAAEGAAAPEIAPHASIRFTTPAATDVIYGPTLIRVEVMPPPGAQVVIVEFFADGRRLAADPRPPYETRWDPGRDMTSHVLRAVARFADGTTAEDRITTRGLRFDSYDLVEGTAIERAELLVSVTDGRGDPVTGLGAGDFDVSESGERVAIEEFHLLRDRIDMPLSVAVLVDRSGSMAHQMKKWREACLELLSAVRPIDQIRVSAFSEETVILQDFTRDALSLAASLDRIGPGIGGTSLFRAVFETVRDMRDLPGRKALILLTDGLDTDYTSVSSPVFAAFYTILQETVRMASRSGVTIVLILPGPTGRGYLAVQDLAVQTGGWYMYPSDDLRVAMRRLGERFLASYVIAYDVPRPLDADRKRPVRVTLKDDRGGDWTVHASLGAYGRLGALEALKDDLRSGSAAQRERAATELGRLPSEEIGPLLVDALRDREGVVRAAAVAALGERREPGALDKVLKAIHDGDATVRERAYEAVVRYGPEAVPALQEEARSRGRSSAPALRALGAIGDPRARPILEDALGAGECAVRTAAADGAANLAAVAGEGFLARRREPESGRLRGRLEAILADRCPEAAEAAALALARMGDPAARPFLIATVRAPSASARLPSAILALRGFPGSETIAAVEAHLEDPEPAGPAARIAAAYLYALAAASAGEVEERDAALGRIVDLGGPEAEAELRRLLAQRAAQGEDPSWTRAVEEALRKLTEAQAPPGP